MDRQLITTDPRFAISSNGERTWSLTITSVQDMDKGEYMCQINTNPMKKMMGYLHVVGEYAAVDISFVETPFPDEIFELLYDITEGVETLGQDL